MIMSICARVNTSDICPSLFQRARQLKCVCLYSSRSPRTLSSTYALIKRATVRTEGSVLVPNSQADPGDTLFQTFGHDIVSSPASQYFSRNGDVIHSLLRMWSGDETSHKYRTFLIGGFVICLERCSTMAFLAGPAQYFSLRDTCFQFKVATYADP